MQMRHFVTTVVFTLMFFGPAKADPGPVVSWLGVESASLLDLGMLKLQMRLNSTKDFIQEGLTEDGLRPVALYDIKKNRINIFFLSYDKFNKEVCKQVISKVRNSFGVLPNGTTLANESIAASFFSHSGYTVKSTPENYLKKLDEIIEVKVKMDGGSCEGPIVSSEVLYRDE